MTPPIIKISGYSAWQGRPGCKPYDTDFYTEMNRIRDGYYKPIVDKYRSITNNEERQQYKIDKLPSLTISAVCKMWRKKENVVNHTGLLNLDIDAKSNKHITDWQAVRDQIFNIKKVVACFLSVSGEGVTFVVKINPDKHKDTFFSIVDEMKMHLGINIDAGLHDITRLRFVSDDPGAKIRYEFDQLGIIEPSEVYMAHKQSFGISETILEPMGEADSDFNFGEAVKKAELQYSFGEGQKWSFLISVAGSCNVMGMSLEFCKQMVLKYFKDKTNISIERLLKPVTGVYELYKSQHKTFNIEIAFERLNWKLKSHFIKDWLHKGKRPGAGDMTEICEQFESKRETAEYIYSRVFGEYSEEFGYDGFQPIKKVQIFLSKRWLFKYNRVTCQPEMTEVSKDDLQAVNEHEIYRQLQLNKFKFGLDNIKSLLKSDFPKSYDPIEDYFKSLQYDNKIDYIDKLSEFVVTEDRLFWAKQFKKSLVRSIACGLGGKENRIVMVLYGQKQETGKTTFIRNLCPWHNKKYFTESPIIGGNTKDTEIRFSENFIYNIEELAGLNRADISKLKADISKSSIKERRPYQTFEVYSPRRCNFWASTNQKEFLHDEENTRWLIFSIKSINWAYKQEVDINKVWAQSWHLFKEGFNSELDQEDRAIREYLNDEYRYRRSEEELIARHFKPAKATEGHFYSSTEVAVILNRISPSLKINPNNIGKSMAAIYNLESVQVKINGKNTRGYWLHNMYTDAEGEQPKFFPATGNGVDLPFPHPDK